MKSKLFTGVATLSGTVIGAGFLGIPYVVSKSGYLFGLVHMFVLAIVMLLVNLMIVEISLSSNVIHQLPGYASKYLGKKTKIVMFLASIFGFYAALIAYLLGEGESLSFILTNSAKYSLVAGIVFWVLLSLITFRGIRAFKKIEPWAVIAVLLVTILLGIVSFNKINLSNLSYTNSSFLFFPFGVVLFAFLGVSAIPEIRRILKNNEKLMKKTVIIGSLIPLAVYILFTTIVLGLYGQGVTEIATISFGKVVTLLGIFTMFTAFMALNLALQDTYRFDFGVSAKKAWLLSVIIPLIAFIFIKVYNLAGFVKILSLGGAVSGGLMAIIILLVHERMKHPKTKRKFERKPEFKINVPMFLKIIFIVLFIAGIVLEFI